jgi:hypothetical protein
MRTLLGMVWTEDAYLDVNEVSDLEDSHVSRQWNGSMVAELAREHVAGSPTVTVCSSHLCS